MTKRERRKFTLEFSDYANWFNKLRIHGTLSHVSPIEYKRSSLKKIVWFDDDNPPFR